MNNFKEANDNLLNPIVGVNMTVNENNIEVEGEEQIESKIVDALNSAENQSETVVASLDGFKLVNNGSKYLQVKHASLAEATIGIVSQSEYETSKDKIALLKSIVKDAFPQTKIAFEGEWREPNIDTEVPMYGEEEMEWYCPECKNTFESWDMEQHRGCPGKLEVMTDETVVPAMSKEEHYQNWLKEQEQRNAQPKKSWLTNSLLKKADEFCSVCKLPKQMHLSNSTEMLCGNRQCSNFGNKKKADFSFEGDPRGYEPSGSEDPEPYADSEQIDENNKYVLWSTPYADHTSYWVSDKEGFELASFSTEEEARQAMATGEGLQMVEEASVAIKDDQSYKPHQADHLAQSLQLEDQKVITANEKIKTEAVNALVSMLQGMGHGSSKIAEVTESSTGYDVMATIDSDGALRAVSIPVTVKEGKVVLPKKTLVSELIQKGLNIQAALTESFSQEVLNKIAAIEELENYKEAEANAIISERVTKTAADEPKTQFLGTNEQVILNKHLIPTDISELSIGDTVHIDGISYKLVSKSKDVLSRGEDDGSQWTFEKVTPVSK